MRLHPKWDVFALGLTTGKAESEEVEKIFAGLVDDYVSRE
jgi:hypothetical protein